MVFIPRWERFKERKPTGTTELSPNYNFISVWSGGNPGLDLVSKKSVTNTLGVQTGKADSLGLHAEFDGVTNQYLSLQKPENLGSVNKCSVFAIFKANTNTGVILNQNYDLNTVPFNLALNTGVTETSGFGFFNGPSWKSTGAPTANLADGNNHTLCGVFTGDTLHLYVDGALDKTTSITQTTIAANNNNFDIGIYRNDNAKFSGQIYDVAIFNDALNPAQIKALHDNYYDQIFKPLKTYFIIGSAGAEPDTELSASGTATLTGTAALTTAIALNASGAVSTTGTAALTTAITLAASGNAALTGTAQLSTAISLNASGTASITGTAALSTAITLSASGSASATGSAELAGTGATLTAEGTAAFLGTAALTTAIALNASGAVSTTGTAALSTAITLSANGAGSITGSAELAGAAVTLSASGAVSATGTAALTTAININASGTVSLTATAALSVYLVDPQNDIMSFDVGITRQLMLDTGIKSSVGIGAKINRSLGFEVGY